MSQPKNPNIPAGTYPTSNTIITVTVDTERIWHAETQEQVIESVTFDNNRGDGVGIGSPGYLSNVKKNTEVTWVGTVKNIDQYPNDQVLIFDVEFHNSPPAVIIPKRPHGEGSTHIDGKSNALAGTVPEDYTISFWVFHSGSGEEGRGFLIDPKMQVHP